MNGLAAKCDFGNQTEGLVYDKFVLKMANKQVQEKICIEPKDNPADALQFAIAFENGLKRQKNLRVYQPGDEDKGRTSLLVEWGQTK